MDRFSVSEADHRERVAARARKRMARETLPARGITDARVLAAMERIPRHWFVEEALAAEAYGEATLPIGEGQTLSQAYTVARMSEALALRGSEVVLEIGAGSGYQTAILSQLCAWVYTIERFPSLASGARRRWQRLGVDNVTLHVGDGTLGWPQARQFDRILITAGAPVTPQNLRAQLRPGGVLVAPEGDRQSQQMVRAGYDAAGQWWREILESCRFVPLVGAQGW
ncbi:protein-L-isoaspartate(D-aspartate) O-methyltransferase [Magnetofaba australis]|uniref:Protein-L-isoaspartate O-methyltransferase n=1 Tax=Magnetofaba australis IT-1 TaxID=1434232 RepID=A0A1Y2K2P4_9PROT|nr:protein-L-isoaspartate(D-aspartate) O-methyltransferase [Magnetofaba australis]OSM01856.1 putative protein-L-isoaspartate O-methyltransferase [Magnetofaba australis IT-1]